jgi:hypothetical protein
MSHTWKLLPLAALAALGAFMLFTGSDAGKVRIADANEPQLTITIDSDPEDGVGYEFDFTNINADNNDDCEDDDGETVVLDDDETYNISCDNNDDPSDEVDVSFSINVPSHSELTDVSCTVTDAGDTGGTQSAIDDSDWDEESANIDLTITDNEHLTCAFDFDFSPNKLTPSVTATTTVGPAATIVISSSNNNLGCGATSIVTMTVRGGNGQPVAAGTIVNIVADKGSVSPASGVTTADGSVFVFYTAPSNSGGEATITAASGSALGTTEIDINCNIAPTQPPPPTAAVGGIQPPNTGDGGLSNSNNSWNTYAGVALILSSVIATLAVVRPRA